MAKRYRILIIDDEKDLTNMAKIQLELDNYEVITAYNGKDGIDKARQSHPDAILLDIRMPEMDGFQVLSELKKDKSTSNIPVIMFTTCSQKEDEEKSFLLGAVDYITKPVNLEHLAIHLTKIIGQ